MDKPQGRLAALWGILANHRMQLAGSDRKAVFRCQRLARLVVNELLERSSSDAQDRGFRDLAVHERDRLPLLEAAPLGAALRRYQPRAVSRRASNGAAAA
jgi:hypothetical protein